MVTFSQQTQNDIRRFGFTYVLPDGTSVGSGPTVNVLDVFRGKAAAYIPQEVTERAAAMLTPAQKATIPSDSLVWNLPAAREIFAGTSQGAQLLQSVQSPVTTAESFRDQPRTGQSNELIAELDKFIGSKYEQGFQLNPNAQLNEKTLLDFMAQAEREIDPYYSTQLKLAKETFQRKLGYTAEDILRQEQEAERKYGKALRAVGEQAAETGFAQSGKRLEAEQELARTTQFDIDETRRKLGFEAGTSAREFAQQYGTQQAQIPTIAQAPRVLAGESAFQKPEGTRQLYELSPETYEGLIGEKEFEQRAAKQSRAAELEKAFRQSQSTPRYLNF